MIDTVNYTYAVLTGGKVPQNSVWYRGYMLSTPANSIQSKLIGELWKNKNENAIGCGTEMLIKLLRCSEYWPDYISWYDPVNTYDTSLVKSPDSVYTGLSWEELVKWSNLSWIPANPKYIAKSSSVEKVISSLFSTLVLGKDGK